MSDDVKKGLLGIVVDEFSLVNKFSCSIICNNRFAKIEKNNAI